MCYEQCPEESHLFRLGTRTPANFSTATPTYTTPESFPADTNGTEAMNKSMPEGKENCWDGGSEYDGYHSQQCTYTSGTSEQIGQHCERGVEGCECLCWGCPLPQEGMPSYDASPINVESPDGSRTQMCFEECTDGASRRCSDGERPESCRCYPAPEAGRLVEISQLKCCTTGVEPWMPDGECVQPSRQEAESDAIISIVKPDSTSCEDLSTGSMERCWHSEDQRGCSHSEEGCECRCYSCNDGAYPLQYGDPPLCYAACPENYQIRCDNDEDRGACACYSCGNSAQATTELRNVRSVLVAECPSVGNLITSERCMPPSHPHSPPRLHAPPPCRASLVPFFSGV